MRSIVILSLIVASTTLALGCSSSTTNPEADTGHASDAISTANLTTMSAVARAGDLFASEGGQKGLRILLSNKENSCSALHFASSTNVDIRVRGDVIGPGSYPIVDAATRTPAAGEAEVDLNAVDGTCKDLVAEAATSGTLTITTLAIDVAAPGTSRASGTIDVTFPSGHVHEDFDAAYCDGSNTPASGTSTACD